MKNFTSFFFRNAGLFLLTLFFTSKFTHAQISLTATGGTTSGSYSTLGAAFSAINSGTHTGIISISVTANTTESTSAVLNASGSGSASYSLVSIAPSGGGTRIITGSLSGSPVIDLNGADNVKINGLNTGGNSLYIENSSTGAGNTSAIRFINDASNNTIQKCFILGAGNDAAGGTILFSTASTTGNDNDTINNCVIDVSGSSFPTNSIFCNGSITAGSENSNICILNNNIGNFFNATAICSGILVSAGAQAWNISGNKLYQAATRTYTAANVNLGISVIAGNGHTIDGNTIGYSNSTGTGVFTLFSTTAVRFVAINLSLGTTATNTITNNIIANITLNTTAVVATLNGNLCGINLIAGNAIISGNLIGASSGTGSLICSSSGSLGAIIGIHSSSTNSVSIQNNVMGAFTSTGSAVSIGGSVIGVSVSGSAASMIIKGNTIGNSTANNMLAGSTSSSTAATVAMGINATAACTVANFSNNIIRNLTSFGTGGGNVRGIYTGTTTNLTFSYTIDSNIISDLNTYSILTSATSGLTAAAGIHYFPGINGSVSYNTIFNINCLNSTVTTNVIATGIALANSSGPQVRRNKIYNITNAGVGTATATPAMATGILIRSGNGNCNIVNNMISLGSGQSTNTTFIGIFANHGSTPNPNDNIYYNTINIEGTVSSGAQPSFAYHRGNFAASATNACVQDIRNNIFRNVRTGGTGKHYAIGNYYGATTPLTAGWGTNASNYNALNADSLTIGYWSADQTFASWKAVSSCDTNSYSRIPVAFVNNANDLHLSMGTSGTMLESGGINISGINTDFDAQSRPGPSGSVNGGAMAPDLGCDEFDGYPLDYYPPSITYPFILNTTSTANRTFTGFATITDYFTGINTSSGTRPRLYFKKSTDNNSFGGNTSATNGWKWVEASNTTSPFSFTIDYSLLNGGSVALNDVIQYFVVAQDLANPINVNSNPLAGFSGGSVSSITSAPTTPNYFVIASTLGSSSVLVGSGQTYTSLTGNGGLFAAINNAILSGNTIANITSDLSEDGTNALNACGMGGYTLTIQSSAAALRVVSNSTNLSQAMIRINGASGVTFDGRSGGSGQYLRVVNTNVTASAGMPAIAFTNGTNNNLLRNCIIESNTAQASQATVYAGTGTNILTLKGNTLRDAQGTPGTAGTPYSAIYSNNTGNKIIVGGAVATDGNTIMNFTNYGLNFISIADSALIQNNNLYQTTSRLTTFFPVSILAGSTHNVSNNNIYQTSGIDSAGFAGIYITGGGTGHVINNNSFGGSNANRTGAAFTFITPVAPAPYYVSGIFLAAGASPATSIQGNYFSNIGNMATGAGAHVFAINVASGNANIGTVTGNTLGGLANASDTIVNGYDNGMINYNGTGLVDIENNNIGNIAYYSAGGDRNSGITILNTCTAIIKNNTVHDIISNSTDAGFPTVYSPFGICVAGGLLNGSIIEGNTIFNIINTNTGAAGYQSVGLYIVASDTSTIVRRNRIYNIKAGSTGTGTSGAKAIGIYNGPGTSGTFSNNQISVGTGALNESIVYGIYDNSTANNNYYYNSIYLNGNTATGANNSFCFYRNSTSNFKALNNIFYNGRTTSGTGKNFAIGFASATNFASSVCNYNLLISSSSASMVQYLTSALDFATWKTTYSKDLSSVSDTTANVTASNLFTSPSTGNLNIQSGNVECWWSNGLGTQISNLSQDFGSAGVVRSVSVANGGTDIGSDEFSPSIAPPDLIISGSHTNNGSEFFKIGGRPIATINWGNNGTLPSFTNAKFYSGTWPNDPTNNGTATGATYFNSYLSILASGGSFYSYDFVFNYDDALLGTIATKSNIILAKKQSGIAGTWNLYGGANNTTTNTLTVSSLKSFSEFTGSEAATPLGPVTLSNNYVTGVQTICYSMVPSAIIGSTPIGGTGTYTYSWLSSTTSAIAGFTAISGASSINYSPGALTVNTWYKRVVTSGTNDTSSAILITVNAVITSNSVSSAQTICSGKTPSTLTGSSPSGGGGSYNYIWIQSTTSNTTGFSVISGATSINYSPPSLTTTTWYRRIVTTSSCKDTSADLQITVITAITNNSISSSQAICSGSVPSTLTGSTPAGGGGSYNYQWYISTTAASSGYTSISGATVANYSPGVTSVNTWYKRSVSTTSCSDTSAPIAISIVAGISNNIIYSAQIICYSSSPFSLNGSTPTGGGGSGYLYQWMQSTTSATSGYTAISGATSGASYSPGALSTTTWYRRLVTAASSSCPDTSAPIEITVNPPIANNTINASQSLCAGAVPATLTGSTPTGGGGNYNYQWMASLVGPSTSFNLLGGANGINYSPGALSLTIWYRRLVTTNTCVDTSAAVQISVSPKITNNSIGTPQAICYGTVPVALTGSSPAGGGGTSYTYQWQSSNSSSTNGFTAISGANAIGYAPPAIAVTTWYRRVVNTTSCADTSAPIIISVTPVLANNTIGSAQTICSGVTPTSLTGSTPTGGGGSYLYQWQESITNATSGFTAIIGGFQIGYSPGTLTSTTWYRRVVTTATCSDTSAVVKITVNSLPLSAITGSNSVCAGKTSNYNVTSQTGATYLWTVTGGSLSAGAGTNSVDITWGAVGTGSISVTVTISATTCSSSTTKNVTINLSPLPTVTGPATVCSGSTQTYSTTGTGNTYNWIIAGGSVSTGQYTNTISVLWGSNSSGKVTIIETAGTCTDSASKIININPTPALPVITRNAGILSINAVTGATYQWYKDGTALTGSNNNSINASINNGAYTVTVTLNGCSATSAQYIYVSTGINKNAAVRELTIYPNPNDGVFEISVNLISKRELIIEVSDATGRIIISRNEGIQNGLFSDSIDLTGSSAGLYLVRVITEDGTLVNRIIKR